MVCIALSRLYPRGVLSQEYIGHGTSQGPSRRLSSVTSGVARPILPHICDGGLANPLMANDPELPPAPHGRASCPRHPLPPLFSSTEMTTKPPNHERKRFKVAWDELTAVDEGGGGKIVITLSARDIEGQGMLVS